MNISEDKVSFHDASLVGIRQEKIVLSCYLKMLASVIANSL